MTLKTVSRHKPSQTAFAYFISIFKHKKRTFWLQPRVSCVTVSNSKISNLVFLLWLHVQFKKYHSLFHVLPRSTALDLSALSLHQLLAQTTWPQNPSVSAWHQAWLLTLTTLLVNYSEMVLASVSLWNKHRPDKTKKQQKTAEQVFHDMNANVLHLHFPQGHDQTSSSAVHQDELKLLAHLTAEHRTTVWRGSIV